MLAEGMRWFVHEKKILESLSIVFGSADTASFFYENADENSLYDLASLTKLFTLLVLMKLYEGGKLDLNAPMAAYDSRFKHIANIKIKDIMAYQVRLVSPARIDKAQTRREGLNLLFDVHAQPHQNPRFYSDMHAMVLKYAIEAVGGLGFYDLLQQLILKPLGMTHTYAAVPKGRIEQVQCYAREHRIENGRYVLREGPPPGIPHDPKAALLSPSGMDLCGHAGLFSTLHDMSLLCRALLSGKLLGHESLRQIAQNRTGHPLPGGGHSQYLGYLCFVKHPDQYFSEVPSYMTQAAFGLSGFTGNHLSIDPQLGIFNVFLGNRCHNRLTVIAPAQDLASLGLMPDGSGQIKWPDGKAVYSSVNYVHQKDAKLHAAIGRMLF